MASGNFVMRRDLRERLRNIRQAGVKPDGHAHRDRPG